LPSANLQTVSHVTEAFSQSRQGRVAFAARIRGLRRPRAVGLVPECGNPVTTDLVGDAAANWRRTARRRRRRRLPRWRRDCWAAVSPPGRWSRRPLRR